MKIKLYAVQGVDGEIIAKVTQYPANNISLCVQTRKEFDYFEGPAYRLMSWAARRDLPYEEITLNIPVEVFGVSV